MNLAARKLRLGLSKSNFSFKIGKRYGSERCEPTPAVKSGIKHINSIPERQPVFASSVPASSGNIINRR